MATPNDPTLQEMGFPAKKPPKPGSLPPLGGTWIAPHYETFAAVINFASRSYYWQFDEALRNDSHESVVAMRNDLVIMGALRDRQTPTCQLDWTIEPLDEANPVEAAAAVKIKNIIRRTPNFQQFKRCLLEALFYGRYGLQLLYEWNFDTGEREMIIRDWSPVNGDKIVFKFSGQPGILVNAGFYGGTTEATGRGLAHFFTPEEQETFLWHEFEPEDCDFYDGLQAGSVHGVGFRGRLYWFWWLRNNLTTILMDFLQKVGNGFTVFYYEQGNEQSKLDVKAAAESQIGNNVFLFPRNRDGATPYAGAGVERREVSMSGAEVFIQLFNLLNSLLRGYIMGETLTTDTAATGLGSGVAEAHESTAERRTKYDAVDLDETLQKLVNVLYRYNCPGVPPGRFHHAVDKPNVAEFMQAAQFAYEMGMALDEDDTREKLGLPKPEEGHSVISKVAPMQPAAVNQIPQGTPMAAPQLPAQPDQGGQQQEVQGQTVGGQEQQGQPQQ